MNDNAVRAASMGKRFGRGVLRMAGIGVREVGKSLYAAVRGDDQRHMLPRQQREVAYRAPAKARAPMQHHQLPYRSVPRGVSAQRRQLMPNPFDYSVSERLGIPHRREITAREYELIRKDMVRKGIR